MRQILTIALFALHVGVTAAAQHATPLSLILEGGEVHDGLGNAPRTADVGIKGDKVVAIGDLSGRSAGRRINVTGLAVVPRFIDIHSHAVRGVFRHPIAENYLRQGVTTAVEGPDGGSPYPIGEFLARL